MPATVSRQAPEILAPVGNEAMLQAALAARADAVYFGLDEGFNARAKARGFSLDTLAQTVGQIHLSGARAYVTLNTLIYTSELEKLAGLLEKVALAGVDALIVQDPATCELAREICPDLRLHASTQMTISSSEGVRFAASLGCNRVVVPRELSAGQIELLAKDATLELEVFIHGALCMSWSGQCLSSEAWDGRSANRGLCNQACRMPYDLIVDGKQVPLADTKYLLSPKDLAGFRAIASLVESGVHSLKIEGRYKPPAYVYTNVLAYRFWRDVCVAGESQRPEHQERLAALLAQSSLVYTRGFSDGHLAGSDHQNLVEGRFPKHRGILLGKVIKRSAKTVEVSVQQREHAHGLRKEPVRLPVLGGAADASSGAAVAPVLPSPGMGIVFDSGHPEDPNEPGGPIFAVRSLGKNAVELDFGHLGRGLDRIKIGDRVWITSDTSMQARVDREIRQAPVGGAICVDLSVSGNSGEPLTAKLSTQDHCVVATSSVFLADSDASGLTNDLLREKLAAFGGTPFHLRELERGALSARLHLPSSELKRLRRQLVQELSESVCRGVARQVRQLSARPSGRQQHVGVEQPRIIVLCRTLDHLRAAIANSITHVELDWMEFVGLRQAVELARAANLHVTIATVRVQKPGEEGYDRRIAQLAPDGVLVRHWGAMMHFAEGMGSSSGLELHGDFSLNVTNPRTACILLSRGLSTLTASHDLDEEQLAALAAEIEPQRLTVALHHHMPLFHNDHCVYARHLSQGVDFRTCGRPCDRHKIALRAHDGQAHPVVVDVECRNTLFSAKAQSAAFAYDNFRRCGISRFRIEFVWEDEATASSVLAAYAELLAGRAQFETTIKKVGAFEQFGVSAGTIATRQTHEAKR